MDSESHECIIREGREGIMDMQDALRKAGISIPEKPSKIEKDSQSTKMKIGVAYEIVDRLDKYTIRYSKESDEEDQFIIRDAIMTKFNELAQFIKDIACVIFNYETGNKNVQNADDVSLSWSIRQIKSTLSLSREQENCLDNFTLRNIAIHDYINSDIYKNDVANFFMGSNRVKEMNGIINIVETYCLDNKIIKS